MIIKHIKQHDRLINISPSAACIGHFDGLHQGHRELIRRTIALASAATLPAALITFEPDPRTIINGKPVPFITTLERKLALIAATGIDIVYVIEFDKELAAMAPTAFIEQMLIPLQIKHLVCGFDFHFGAQGLGDTQLLEKLARDRFTLAVVEPMRWENRKISSSWISIELREGNMELANRLLTEPFTVTGRVVKGHQIGRKLNFPTANIAYAPDQILPKCGVYVGRLEFAGQGYAAMINVGRNPTFYAAYDITIEVHILDFHDDIYDQDVSVSFLQRLRDEQKFNDADALIAQMKLDRLNVRRYFASQGYQ